MEGIADIIRPLERVKGYRRGKGATLAEIRAAEKTLGVKFPAPMREFLKDVGWVRARGFALFGLGKDTPPTIDIVKATLEWQRYRDEPLLKGLVPLSGEVGSLSVCLDCRPNTKTVMFLDDYPRPHEMPKEYVIPGPPPKIDKRLFKSMMQKVLPTAEHHARPTYKVVYWDFDYDPTTPGLQVAWESYMEWLRWELDEIHEYAEMTDDPSPR